MNFDTRSKANKIADQAKLDILRHKVSLGDTSPPETTKHATQLVTALSRALDIIRHIQYKKQLLIYYVMNCAVP